MTIKVIFQSHEIPVTDGVAAKLTLVEGQQVDDNQFKAIIDVSIEEFVKLSGRVARQAQNDDTFRGFTSEEIQEIFQRDRERYITGGTF